MHTEHVTGHMYKEGVMTKMGGAMDLMVYTQHHSWILFSSLCLAVASTINKSLNTTNGVCIYVLSLIHILTLPTIYSV